MTTSLTATAPTITTEPTIKTALAPTTPTTPTASMPTVKYPATVGTHLNYYFDTLPISWGMEIIPLPIIGYETEYGSYIYEALSN